MCKKLISLLLVAMMVVSVMAVAVVSGSAATPGTTWYVRGDFNNWEAREDYIMVDDDGDGVYTLSGIQIGEGEEFKVANNNWSESYPGGNYKVNDAGTYTILFNADTNTVTLEGVAPEYYLIGTINGWTANDPDHKLIKNEKSDIEEYMIEAVYLTTGDMFKVYSNSVYYPDGWNTDYGANGEIESDGYYDIYFRPNGNGGDGWFYNCIYVAEHQFAYINGYTISLKDEIAVNYYVYISDTEYGNDITATYSYGTGDYAKQKLDATVTPANSAGDYKISCPINARAMTDTVTLSVYAGETEVLSDNSYRIVKYCEDAASEYSGDSALKKLLCATLMYGGEVQKYYGYNTDDLASRYVSTVDQNWADEPITHSLEDETTLNDCPVFNGATMSTTGQTSIRLYFEVSETGEAMPAIKVDGNDAYLVKSNSSSRGWYIVINSSAKNIFKDYTITVDNDTYTYNAANYYNAVMSSDDDAIKKAQNVMGRMYLYYKYAKAYNN